MQDLPFRRGTLMGFSMMLLLILGFHYCKGDAVEVTGTGECVDCMVGNIKNNQPFKGLRVIISCRAAGEKFKTKGVGELDEKGKFKVILPSEFVSYDGKLKEECFAQLHNGSNAPCPTTNGFEAYKIVLKSKDNGKHTYTPDGKLKFSQVTCIPKFKKPNLSAIPKTHLSPIPKFRKPVPTPIPKFEKPFPKFKKPFPKLPLKPQEAFRTPIEPNPYMGQYPHFGPYHPTCTYPPYPPYCNRD